MSARGGKKGTAAKAELTGPEKAVDELRKRIASEAEIIVHETMPRKVPRAEARKHAPPHAAPARVEARACGACLCARALVMVPGAQVAELTRILEEDELFQYPKEDDLIGPVRDPSALPRPRVRGCSVRRGPARPLRAALTHWASPEPRR